MFFFKCKTVNTVLNLALVCGAYNENCALSQITAKVLKSLVFGMLEGQRQLGPVSRAWGVGEKPQGEAVD
jgi:hypothetical protein